MGLFWGMELINRTWIRLPISRYPVESTSRRRNPICRESHVNNVDFFRRKVISQIFKMSLFNVSGPMVINTVF